MMNDKDNFQNLVDQFGLNKSGANPFNAELLDGNYAGASHGEKVTIAFLLKGEISAKVDLEVTGASKAAVEAVEKAGGSLKVTKAAAAE